MKKILLTIAIAVAFNFCFGQAGSTGVFWASRTISSFERDGRIWISYDQKDAPTQVFTPLDQVYECTGNYLKIISANSPSKKGYRIYFGKEWIDVSRNERNNNDFSQHMMFDIGAACFDKDYVYCQCGEKFKILNKNFK